MARTDQGDELRELKLQAGSNFKRTRRGLDTGSRTWKIDTEYAEEKAPQPGDADRVHKTMFVDEVDMEHEENGVTTITATYLGLMNPKRPKPDEIVENADGEQVTTKPRGRQRFIQYFRPIPRVTVTYVRAKKESVMEVGRQMKPPVDYGTDRKKGYEADFVPEGEHLVFMGWILKSREVRAAGMGKKGSVFEMTDVFTYETITAPEEP